MIKLNINRFSGGSFDYKYLTVDEFKNKWFKNKEATQQIKLNAIKRHLEEVIKILKGE